MNRVADQKEHRHPWTVVVVKALPLRLRWLGIAQPQLTELFLARAIVSDTGQSAHDTAAWCGVSFLS